MAEMLLRFVQSQLHCTWGYLDNATRIAQSSGGGPGTGRGKRDDEDNFAFRRRCFGMAMKMMRPGHQQRRKR